MSNAEENGTLEHHEVREPPELEAHNEERRLTAIHDARARVSDVRELIADPTVNREYSRRGRLTALFEAVKSYAFELESVMRDVAEVEYWRDKPLGEVVVRPPADAIEAYETHESRVPGDVPPPEPREYDIVGLGEFVELDPPFREEFVVEWGDRNGIESQSYVATASVPRPVSDHAYRACNQFCFEIGIAVGLDNSSNTSEMNYSDLVDEDGELAGVDASRFDDFMEKIAN